MVTISHCGREIAYSVVKEPETRLPDLWSATWSVVVGRGNQPAHAALYILGRGKEGLPPRVTGQGGHPPGGCLAT